MADAAPKPTLLELAANRFDRDILSAEEKLFTAVENGEQADCGEGGEIKGVIRGDRLTWLCTDVEASAKITHRGVSIVGAEIDGKTDLASAKIAFPIQAFNCVFKDRIDLSHSRLFFLNLGGCSTRAIYAASAAFEDSVFLRRGFKATGGVVLGNATIQGTLDCSGGEFVGDDKIPALNAEGANIQGQVFFNNGFKATGRVILRTATVEGSLNCVGGLFVGNGPVATLNANGANIRGAIFFRKDFEIGKGFRVEGGVDLRGAKIGIHLECDGGEFVGDEKVPALHAAHANIQGAVFMGKGFNAKGSVDFSSAVIGGFLDCRGGQFIANRETPALAADSVEIGGSVHLSKEFNAKGGVNLRSATIEGNLDCSGGEFVGKSEGKGYALDADSAKIGGSVFFRDNAVINGIVNLTIAHIGNGLQWKGLKGNNKASLKLTFAKCEVLWHDEMSWPEQGNLQLDGFIYDRIEDQSSPDANNQLGWIKRQNRDKFLPQPYEQLAAVFRRRGLEEHARQVMIEKNKEHARHLHAPKYNWGLLGWFDWISWLFRWFWYRNFGNALVGYGYRPGRAFGWSILVIVIGWLVFQVGYNSRLVTPTDNKAYVEKDGTRRLKDGRPQISKDYPKFNGFVYSVETFVPLLKLGIGEHWSPNANLGGPYGSLLRGYMWLHIILGWVLGTLWIGGLTKLLKT
jgi:hypothetical protein